MFSVFRGMCEELRLVNVCLEMTIDAIDAVQSCVEVYLAWSAQLYGRLSVL